MCVAGEACGVRWDWAAKLDYVLVERSCLGDIYLCWAVVAGFLCSVLSNRL